MITLKDLNTDEARYLDIGSLKSRSAKTDSIVPAKFLLKCYFVLLELG